MIDLKQAIELWQTWAEYDPPSIRGVAAANEVMKALPDLVQEIELLRGSPVKVDW